VEVIISSRELDRAGMVIDFGELKIIVNRVLEKLDHKHLNELEYFSVSYGGNVNPSCEEISRYLFEKLKDDIVKNNCRLDEVRVWETANSCAIYSDDTSPRPAKKLKNKKL
jgi:6-pyruvoyltetrahydropterin/6-carboxytetrahydropterin synthase